jgi:hypothetical protein
MSFLVYFRAPTTAWKWLAGIIETAVDISPRAVEYSRIRTLLPTQSSVECRRTASKMYLLREKQDLEEMETPVCIPIVSVSIRQLRPVRLTTNMTERLIK